GKGWSNRLAYRAQKRINDGYDDHSRQNEGEHDFADRLANEDGVVRCHGDRHILRQRLLQLVNRSLDTIRNCDRIRLRLTNDLDTDGRLAIKPRVRRRILEGPPHERHVADLRLRIDFQPRNVGRRGYWGLGADDELL